MSEPETSIFALSSDDAGIFHWNVDTNLLCADEHFAEIFGLDADGVRDGLPIEAYLAAVWEGDRRDVAKTLHHAISTGGSCFQDYHVTRPDGSIVHVVGIGRCFRNIEGEATRYVGVVFDDVELDAGQIKKLLSDQYVGTKEAAFELEGDTASQVLTRAMNRAEEDDQKKKSVVVHH
ncbi:PAS domain-containing protein [Rhizobium panacihumi]|uniref:PAS domain-containing protein n=1 Tax=Rhizobium panacihumi TaxID=2008450 RepID=UPI003D78CCAC